MTEIIAIANHKGGSGKTTTTYYLGLGLLALGKNVLYIDLDDQGTLTDWIGRKSIKDQLYGYRVTIADVLDGHPLDNAVRTHPDDPHFSWIPADHKLGWMAARMQAASPNHAFLRKAWSTSQRYYDYILIDCPPSAGVLMINALALANRVIIPATPTLESYDGACRLKDMCFEIGEVLDHRMTLMGTVITMISASSTAEAHWIKQLEQLVGGLGCVPRRVGIHADEAKAEAYADIAKRLVREIQQEIDHAA